MNQHGKNCRDEDAPAVRRAQGGDQEAFDALVHKHTARVRAFCKRLLVSEQDGEDAFQDTWVRAWDKIGTFRFECLFVNWLIRVATRICLNTIQRNRGICHGSADDLEAVPGGERPDDVVLDKFRLLLEISLQRGRWVDPRTKKRHWDALDVAVFHLYCERGLQNHRAIAKMLGENENTLKYRFYHRIAPILRDVWDELSGE